ncbi:DmsC/YnfH family molybdoenzyme membrane anchor subunit [uncultured Adlercreutzia sp.]|jgi:anaerobic dimethyl sulfoxide reductase subunit C (anchor subunit)|uniref:dimethyl sulfoxide reductase anchor subunit family protein n=1 Tax=Adlercreutzia sp. TaxID=1872387 RepID=UPI002666EB33|nr:DmsC/YnfH family molybdoenzyme membrane anchor subunit [uncultured Adlercreutzia sp.]
MAPKIQWPLVLFSMLAGCGGCCFAFAGVAGALGESTTVTLWATGISLVLVVVGAVCSMMHLATPRHAFAAVTHLLSFSGISVELIMLGVVSALMAAYGAACLWFDNELARLVLGIAGAVAGVVLAFVTGHGYLISSKPTWNTKKLPLAYTGTALVAGGFLYAVVSVATGGVWAMELPVKLLLAVCAVFSAVTVAAYLGHLGMQTAKKNPTLFWVGIVVCGLVVPLACAAILLAPLPSMAFVAVAAVGFVAAMAGGLSLRMLMWIVGAGFLFFFEDAQANRSAILNC